jgi:outer membrane protein assembly factor BamD (BamD/ComL family)
MIPAKPFYVIGVVVAGMLTILSGCHVPPAPPHSAQQGPPPSSDSDEGWLWRQLRGEDKAKNSAAAQPQANTQTVPKTSPQVQPQTPASPSLASQPSSPYAPGNQPAANPVIPAVGSYSAGSNKNQTIVPTVAIVPINPRDPDEIPMSQVEPAQPVLTPPPVLPPEPPPSIVSSNTAVSALEKKGFEWADLAPENVYKNLKKAAGYGPNEAIARASYREGQTLFAQKNYMEAAKKFSAAADRWPDTPLEEDALFLKAESYFFADEYVKAHDTFEALFKKYSNTRHLETAVAREFAIGRFWEQMQDTKPLWTIQPNFFDKGRPWFGTFSYALKAYRNVQMYDPTGPLADHGIMAIGTAYFRNNEFENAAMEFDQLRKDYPNSEHQMLAHVLGVQSKMRVYQGKFYDATALKEAHEIADSALMQFGPKLGEEQARMAQARIQIIEKEADNEFSIGQYYEKNKYYRAARTYYTTVVQDYPTTKKAQQAKERLAAIQNEPDVPPNQFQWLIGLFPESKRR